LKGIFGQSPMVLRKNPKLAMHLAMHSHHHRCGCENRNAYGRKRDTGRVISAFTWLYVVLS